MYRILLRLYPASVRRADGEAMLETLETRLGQAHGRAARMRIAAREAVGLLAGALRERLGRRIRPHRVPSPGGNPMNGFVQDLRYAVRVARRDPGFTTVVVLTLALGIGANVAIFSVVDAVLLRPLPYDQPGRLVRMAGGGGTVTKAVHAELRARMTSVTDVSAYATWGVTVGGSDDPEVVSGGVVSANHFDLLGARAAIGRTFLPSDAEPGNDDVAVLSWGLWQRRFGGDESIVGRRLPIDEDSHPTRVVIGVMPADHRPVGDWQLWMPYRLDPSDERDYTGSWYLAMVARLAEGSDPDTVTAELRDRLAALAGEERFGLDDPERISGAYASDLREYLVGPVRDTLFVLLGAVGLVLLIATSNVANLMLARSIVRRRELAIRDALGASRKRVLRQLLTESVVLSGAGAAIGLAGAALAVRAAAASLADVLPRAESIAVDGRVIAFAAGLAVTTGLLFGTVPSLLVLRRGPRAGLAGGRGAGRGDGVAWASRALIVAEVAVACVVVVGAGLMVRTLHSLWSVPPGFDADRLAVARAIAPSARYPGEEEQRGFWSAAVERLAAVPGIERAAAIHLLPLSQDGNWSFPFLPEGLVLGEERQPLPIANFRVVTPGYFATMGIPVIQGRDFDGRDGADDAGVVIINRRMAEELWPGESPLGKRLDIFGSLETRVVGVVGDVRQHRLELEPLNEMYRPAAQWPLARMVVVARSERPAATLRSIEQALHSVDASVPVFGLAPMTDVIADSLSSTRLTVYLLGSFAGLALLLGAVGVYGVMSWMVTRRTREIGIRMALGASARGVRRSVVSSAMRTVALGLAIGVTAAYLGLRVIASLLYGVEARDLPTYLAVVGTIALAGLAAGWVPAHRASRVEPLRALRID